MAFNTITFNVMIASPSDVIEERNIIREIVDEWNVLNAMTTRTTLMSVGWETHSFPHVGDAPQDIINWQLLDDCDLLIAVFWTRLGTPTRNASSGTVEEITKHVNAGKPAMVYFSDMAIPPDKIDNQQLTSLRQFKELMSSKSLYNSYSSNDDFKEQLRRHLGFTISKDVYISRQYKQLGHSVPGTRNQTANDSKARISLDAYRLLVRAVNERGEIGAFESLDGFVIDIAGKTVAKEEDPRSRAAWESVIDELVEARFIKDVSGKGEFYRVTTQGYDFKDSPQEFIPK